MELLSYLTGAESVARYCSTDPIIRMLVSMSTLLHRPGSFSSLRGISTSDEDEAVPVIDLNFIPEHSSVSSVPMTHLSIGESRLRLMWMIKAFNSADATAVGPFSIVDLKQYIDRLVEPPSSITACCCTIHEKHDSDEHEWHLLNELPDLRWIELMDDPVDPSSVGLRSLQVLRNILVNEPAAQVDGVRVLPLPTAVTLMGSTGGLAHITQLLLVENGTVRRLSSEILIVLGTVASKHMFELGLFFFAFAVNIPPSKWSSFVEVAKLLKLFHRVQECQENRTGQSYLLNILPEALIGILDCDSPEHFAQVFLGHQVDGRVLWSTAMRSHLRQMILEHIEEFTEDLTRDVSATYRYVSIPPVKYMELSRDVHCGGYFLSTIAEGDDSSLDGIEEPQMLMAAIEEKWKSLVTRQASALEGIENNCADALKVFGWGSQHVFTLQELRARYRDLCKKGVEVTTVRSAYEDLCNLLQRKNEADSGRTSDDVIYCILKAQLRLLDTFTFQFFSYESKVLPLLLRLIIESPSDTAETHILDGDTLSFQHLGVHILQRMLAAAPLNIEKLLSIDGVWDKLLDIVDVYEERTDLSTKEAVFAVLQIVVSAENGPRSLLNKSDDSTRARPIIRLTSDTSEDQDDEFFTHAEFNSSQQLQTTPQSKRLCEMLDRLLSGHDRRQPWQIQQLLFAIVSSLCRSKHIQDQLVLTTKLFWRALYVLLSAAEDAALKTSQDNGFDIDSIGKKEREVIESAFSALRAMSTGLDGNHKSYGYDSLAHLLPFEVLDCLNRESGHDFWTILASDIREPTCIWNATTRSELVQLIGDHCGETGEDELSFLEFSTGYVYDCLESEPRVGGVFLRILIEKTGDDQQSVSEDSLYPSTPIEFVEQLFEFLNENRDPTLAIYADTLPALECLNVLVDVPIFRDAVVAALERAADFDDIDDEAVSVATLGRYLLPYDRADPSGMMSISSRRSLSSYGFMSRNPNSDELDGLPAGMEAEFGNVDYLNRQEYALLILNKICGFECSLEKMLVPFRKFAWSLQVIADHLDYEQAYFALSCLAELCDTCLVVADYVEQSGLWVEVLGIAIQSRQHVLHEHFLRAEALREPAFEVLYALLSKDFVIRERMYSSLCKFLPYPIVYQIHLDPSKATQFFDDNHEKSDLIWNSQWRTEVRRKLDQAICRNRVERSKAKRDSVILEDEDYVQQPENFVAGLHLDWFLSRPDPEQLTNPAYNLELLFQEWKEKLSCLMGFDLENPPEFLKELGSEVEKLTTAMIHILRAPLELDEAIDTFQMPSDIVKLVRHCNRHVIAGFPYRCALRVARQLVSFPELRSRDFFELLFCRITVEHPDLPALVKVVRRLLEARSQHKNDVGFDDFLLRDLQYFSTMVKFLEGLVDKKDGIDGKVLSNTNRILRIIRAESKELEPSSRSFFQRASARWQNYTLTSGLASRGDETSLDFTSGAEESGFGPSSFDVDREHEPSNLHGTFNVDDERAEAELAIPAPPKSLVFDGDSIQEVSAPPASFRFVNGKTEESETTMPVIRASTIRANFEPVDSQYHSNKAAEYEDDDTEPDVLRTSFPSELPPITAPAAHTADVPTSVRAPPPPATYGIPEPSNMTTSSRFSFGFPSFLMSDRGSTSSRRYSLMDSWRAPTSAQPNPLLSTMTISRRGRRAAANYSRRKAHSKKGWFGGG